jgi:phosphoribosylglycinamide formyltransferase 1
MNRLVILASGSGSNAQALLDATRSGDLAAEVAAVVSDCPDAGALRRASIAGVAAVALPIGDRRDARQREAYDRQLADVVASFEPDLVVLAGWMLILTPHFLDRFPGKIINVHPALLPDGGETEVLTSHGSLPALRGARAVRDALRKHLPVTGATVHHVTTDVDAGPVILREEVPILPGDDEERLHARIKAVEHRLLPRAVAMVLEAAADDSDGGVGRNDE